MWKGGGLRLATRFRWRWSGNGGERCWGQPQGARDVAMGEKPAKSEIASNPLGLWVMRNLKRLDNMGP